MSSIEAGVGSKSRGSSEDSENSPPYFDAPMEGETLEAFESQLLRMQRTDIDEPRSWNPARHSTSACIGMERPDLENARWSSLHWRNGNVKTANFDGSFRSEDSEILALWEEKSEAGGVHRLGGRRGKTASSDTGRQKPVGLGSPWRDSVSNAVKKIESLSHAMVNNKEKQPRNTWPRCSPIHPKAGGVDSPRQSVDKNAAGDRSPWRELTIATHSSPMRDITESLLHNSPKARYSFLTPSRRGELDFSLSPISAPKLFRDVVTSELENSSPASVDFNSRRKDDSDRGDRSLGRNASQNTRVSVNEDELTHPDGQEDCYFSNFELSMPTKNTSIETPPRVAKRASDRRSSILSLDSAVEGALPPRFFVEAGEKVLSRQCAKLSLKALSESMERCSAHSMDEALLNEYASEAGGQQSRSVTLASGERKASHRYYQRVTSAERSSRWSSCDGNYLDAIDFVAPSAARFLEGSDGCVSPVLAPIKTQGAVPFQWENEPGKPKNHSQSATYQSHSTLQLPPRLAASQQKQDPRQVNVAMSETDSLPIAKPATSLKLPRARSNSEKSAPHSSPRSPGIVKSRSIGEVRAALQNLSRQSAGEAGIGETEPRQCTSINPPQPPPPPQVSGKVRPTSPTSILCGPDDGSWPSSNPSLCSEQETSIIITATRAPSLSHGSSPSRVSYHSRETTSPESSLTSPLRANSRCNSMSFDEKSKEDGGSQSANALVKFYKNGKRWMKGRGQNSKLGMIVSPDSVGLSSVEGQGGSEFTARLGSKQSQQHVSRIDHSNVQTDGRFAPCTVLQEDLGNWSPAYAATLELLSPLQEFSSKTKNHRKKKPFCRKPRKTSRRLRVRIRVRTRFLVPIRRALTKMLSTCAFRRHPRKVKTQESRLLYHVDYTLSPADFSFDKPN